MTPEEFRRFGHAMIDRIADYRANLAEPGEIRKMLPADPPEAGQPMSDVFADFDRIVVPGVSHFQHPRFFGYFPSNALLSGVLGDLASTGLGVVGLSWQSGPALTELEEVMCSWMRRMVGLSDAWSGVIQDTASASTLVALITARERATNYTMAKGGLQSATAKLAVYVSEHSHSSVMKAAILAGFGREQVRLVPNDAEFAMRADALAEMVVADVAAGIRPCAVVAASGTTATTALDPVGKIAELAKRHGLWVHVDAAMAGGAMIIPECRWMWEGIEGADSIVLNPHKWLGVPFDCSLYFVRDPQHLIRVMSTNPSFLRTSVDAEVTTYRDWGIPLGRRFRALKLWFVIREQGVEALRARIRRDMGNAKWLEEQVRATPNWRVIAPVHLQTVCIRHEPPGLEGEALDNHTLGWAERINASGVGYLTPAVVDGRWMVRISIGAEATERDDVEAIWRAIRAEADRRP